MKSGNLLLIIVFIMSFYNSYSQKDYSLLINNWTVTKGASSTYTIEIDYMPYHKLHFKTQKLVSAYPRIIVDGITNLTYEYQLANDSLTIFAGYNTIGYYIEVLTSDSLVLIKGDNTYTFNSYIPIDKNKMIINGDTIESYRFKKPQFKGDYYHYLENNLIVTKKNRPSFNVNVAYSIDKNGNIVNINVVSEDSVLSNKTRELIKNTTGKWKPGRKNNENSKSSIHHKILVINNTIEFNDISKPQKRAKKLFNKGYDLYLTNDMDSALIYYSECSVFCEFIYSIEPYRDTYVNLHNYWVNSTLNKAAVYLNKGLTQRACKELKKIILYDNEANHIYNNYCREKE